MINMIIRSINNDKKTAATAIRQNHKEMKSEFIAQETIGSKSAGSDVI